MENQIVLGAAFAVISTLAGALVWLVKSWIKQTNTIVNDCRKSLDHNSEVMENCVEMMKTVIALLNNWRAR